MKTYLIILILVLCFTCWLNDPDMPPSPQPIVINKVPASAFGVKRQESMIPDFVYTDQQRRSAYATKIDEDSAGEDVEFPIGTR